MAMRILLCGCMLTLFAGGALGDDPLWIALGQKNEEHGLSVPSSGDGENRAEIVAGSACRRIAGENSLYLYVRAGDARIPARYDEAYIAFEYFDAEMGIALLQYDRFEDGGDPRDHCRTAEDLIVMTGTGQWQRSVLRLPQARLAHRLNGRTDLRLWCKDLAVRKIEVFFDRPADYIAGGFDPRSLESIRTSAGRGVEVTFGAGTSDIAASRLPLLRAIGATSVESYVTWQSCEPTEGTWDWRRWDRHVAELRHAGLKWVPLLIAGPVYATPAWFRESKRAQPYVCLEHGQRSEIQSLWNPAWRGEVERFIDAFAARYGDSGAIESVMLGISGIYGETLYPTDVPPGDTIAVPFPFHCHSGWWAGDPWAVADFRRFLRQRYVEIGNLNGAWRATYASFDAVQPMLPAQATSPRARLDFVEWYQQSMTEYAAFWAAAVRKRLPGVGIYMSVGGSGQVRYGADFSAIAKAVAPYDAGIRITNEGDDFLQNFADTAEVATATRAFGTYVGNEPAGRLTDVGNVTRIANATAAGARQWFSYDANLLNARRSLKFIHDHIHLMRGAAPEIHAGFYLPKTSWMLDERAHDPTHRMAAQLRRRLDLQLVDRLTLEAQRLGDMHVLAVAHSPLAEAAEIDALRRWVSAGNILIAATTPNEPLLRTVEGSDDLAKQLLAIGDADGNAIRFAAAGAPPRHVRLEIGKAGDEDYLFGDWYGAEKGLEFPQLAQAGKRWTGAHARVRLACNPDANATLIVYAQLLNQSLPGVNRILVNGTEIARLTETGARMLRFAIPRKLLGGKTCATVEFDIQTFDPTQFGSRDTRRLGLAVACVELFAAGAEAEPAQACALVPSLDWNVVLHRCTRRIGQGATIVLPLADANMLGAAMVEVLARPGELAPGLKPVALPGPLPDGIYTSQTADGTLLYNANATPCRVPSGDLPAHGARIEPR